MFGGPAGAGTNPVASGVELAARRLERYGIQFSPDAVQETVGRAIDVLREEVGDRTAGFGAVEMFVESVAVGAVVRNVNHEASLTNADLQQALEVSEASLTASGTSRASSDLRCSASGP